MARSIPPVSIIIPALNEEAYLPLLLDSLHKLDAPLDIIVVDGNSSDRTVAVAKEFVPSFTGNSSLRVIRSEQRGIGFQRNLGAVEAKHEVLIFCDADMLVPSAHMHERIVTAFVGGVYVAAAPVLVPIEQDFLIRVLHKLLTLIFRLSHAMGKSYLPGGYLITTKSIFGRIGGFDASLTLAEDIDYSVRAGAHGRYGLLDGYVFVSARRIAKYGYGWLFKAIPDIHKLIVTGKMNAERIFYPFGEFGTPSSKSVVDTVHK